MENEQDIFIRNKYDSDESSNELELVVEKDEAPKEQEKVEGNINGQNIFEFDISALDDKPWNKPGADITDYFNYGFNETTWREYCNMQKNKNLNPQKIKNDANRKYDNYKSRRDNVDEGDNKYRYTREENRNRRYDYSNKY